MLHIMGIEEIEGMLMEIPGLIDRLEARDARFLEQSRTWFSRMEEVLANNRLAVAGDVAALRGALIATERGNPPADLVPTGGRVTAKVKEAAGADLLRRAGDLLRDVIRPHTERIAEGQRLARQMIALAQQKKIYREQPCEGDEVGERTARLRNLLSTMARDPELGPLATHLIGLVGTCDVLILLDRASVPSEGLLPGEGSRV